MKRKNLYLCILFLTYSIFVSAQNIVIPQAPLIGAKSFILLDGLTGTEIASLDADKKLAPASLTKLMTAYTVFRALDANQIEIDEDVFVSEEAWQTEGSRMFIEVGTTVKVKDLLLGMIVQSGNDASVALAEHTAGTEELFAHVMNQYAAQLDMSSSNFKNSTGLHHKEHFTTARDMGKLALAIINEFPEYYQWYSVKEFKYNDINQRNRNTLLWRDPSVDGMKTGFTSDAGYCLVSSAKRNNTRLISVVLGTSSTQAREKGSSALLNYGFRFFETKLVYKENQTVIDAITWKGENEKTPLGLNEDLYITLPKGSYDQMQSSLALAEKIIAPVNKGETIGELSLVLENTDEIVKPLVALKDNPAGSFWRQTLDQIKLWLE